MTCLDQGEGYKKKENGCKNNNKTTSWTYLPECTLPLIFNAWLLSCKAGKAADWYNNKNYTLSEGNSLLFVIRSTH